MLSPPQPAPEATDPEGQTAFNDMLGFDPFSPPDIMKDHSSVGGESSGSSVPTQYAQQPTQPAPISKPYFSRNSKPKKNKKFNPDVPSTDNSRVSSEEVPKLAFDLDSGRVYDEKTGKWFRLVDD